MLSRGSPLTMLILALYNPYDNVNFGSAFITYLERDL